MTSDADATLQSLRENLSAATKMRFCVKIWTCLMYTLKHPESSGEIGLAWCDDGVRFICNSLILAQFLKLKPNSVNTNFRAHGFVIVPEQLDHCYSEIRHLPDKKNWKVRRNTQAKWDSKMSKDDAENVPFQEATRTLQLVPENSISGIVPSITKELIGSDTMILREVDQILQRIAGTDTWKSAVLKRVTQEWQSMTDGIGPIPPSVFIKQVFDKADPPLLQSANSIEPNIKYVINMSGLSEVSEGFRFLDFLQMVLRFGCLAKIAHTFVELSDCVQTSLSPSFNLSFPLPSDPIWSQSQRELTSFVPWFIPSADKDLANDRLNSGLTWIVRYSSTWYNCFTIEKRQNSSHIATHIQFDPISLRDEGYYTVEFAGGERKSCATLVRLLCEVLQLNIPDSATPAVRNEPVKFVSGDVLSRNN